MLLLINDNHCLLVVYRCCCCLPFCCYLPVCRSGIFERMPVLSIKKDDDLVGGDSPVPNGNKEEPVKQVSLTAPPTQQTQQESLLDLLGGDINPIEQPVSMATEGNSLLDLLDSTPTFQTTGNTHPSIYW